MNEIRCKLTRSSPWKPSHKWETLAELEKNLAGTSLSDGITLAVHTLTDEPYNESAQRMNETVSAKLSKALADQKELCAKGDNVFVAVDLSGWAWPIEFAEQLQKDCEGLDFDKVTKLKISDVLNTLGVEEGVKVIIAFSNTFGKAQNLLELDLSEVALGKSALKPTTLLISQFNALTHLDLHDSGQAWVSLIELCEMLKTDKAHLAATAHEKADHGKNTSDLTHDFLRGLRENPHPNSWIGMGGLQRLVSLDVSNQTLQVFGSMIVGEVLLPEMISLEVLRYGDNRGGSVGAAFIAKGLLAATEKAREAGKEGHPLKVLRLGDSLVGAQEAIGDVEGDLPADFEVPADAIHYLDKALPYMHNLSELYLDEGKVITKATSDALKVSGCPLKKLQFFADCDYEEAITMEVMGCLADVVRTKHSTLTHLTVNGLDEGKGLDQVFAALNEKNILEELNLDENLLSEVSDLSDVNLPCLHTLSLLGNDFEDDDLEGVREKFQNVLSD